MKDRGNVLEVIQGCAHIGDIKANPGLWLFILKDIAPDQINDLRRYLEENHILALLMMERAIKEVRHLDKMDLKLLRESVNEALGEITAIEEAVSKTIKGKMTPERVIAALRKKPELYEAVRELMLTENVKL